MDEPSMGLSPILVKEIFRIIASARAGITILLVEQKRAHGAVRIRPRLRAGDGAPS
jgi:branched-chain amino acid transport system ATP-binding protein